MSSRKFNEMRVEQMCCLCRMEQNFNKNFPKMARNEDAARWVKCDVSLWKHTRIEYHADFHEAKRDFGTKTNAVSLRFAS